MKHVLLVLIFAAAGVCNDVDAQSLGRSYKTALGVKVWDGAGISLKTFVDNNNALEFIAYKWRSGTRITGLYEVHGPLSGAPGLKWYVGPGAHLSFYKHKNGGHTAAGIDGVLGLDFKVNKAPINFSIDWQPSFEFGENNDGFIGSWGGLGVRYTF